MTNAVYNLSCVQRYDTKICLESGLIDNLNRVFSESDFNLNSNHILVTDDNLSKLYLNTVISQLQDLNLKISVFVIEAGEGSKSLSQYVKLIENSLDAKFDKHSIVFSLGGGVVNNIAGFLAATLYRGLQLIHIPTTLLSQVDATIDFKQGINFKHGKNLVGAYYPATHVIADPMVLKTLDKRFMFDGLAESIKHALCGDTDFLSFLEDNDDVTDDPEKLHYVIDQSIQLKLSSMHDDLHDQVDEAIKQYGHALGHAIEHMSNGLVFHGEAISIGMCMSAEIAQIKGICTKDTVRRHYEIFKKYNLPTVIPDTFSKYDVWQKMRYDKHYHADSPYMSLLSDIGKIRNYSNSSVAHPVTYEEFQLAMNNSLCM